MKRKLDEMGLHYDFARGQSLLDPRVKGAPRFQARPAPLAPLVRARSLRRALRTTARTTRHARPATTCDPRPATRHPPPALEGPARGGGNECEDQGGARQETPHPRRPAAAGEEARLCDVAAPAGLDQGADGEQEGRPPRRVRAARCDPAAGSSRVAVPSSRVAPIRCTHPRPIALARSLARSLLARGSHNTVAAT